MEFKEKLVARGPGIDQARTFLHVVLDFRTFTGRELHLSRIDFVSFRLRDECALHSGSAAVRSGLQYGHDRGPRLVTFGIRHGVLFRGFRVGSRKVGQAQQPSCSDRIDAVLCRKNGGDQQRRSNDQCRHRGLRDSFLRRRMDSNCVGFFIHS